MKIDNINFNGFEHIREELVKITRYHMFEIMFYRTNDETHSKNVYYLLKNSLGNINKIYPGFDCEKALVMALIHDDSEVLIGDFQAGIKARLSSEELADVHKLELDAIEKMSESLPKEIHGYNYKELLLEVFHMNTIESSVVKYLDRYDAFGESCHELFAGNVCFATHVVNEYGKCELPTEFYIKRFNDYRNTYPMIVELIQSNEHPFLTEYKYFNLQDVASNGSVHTMESLENHTISSEYNYWKRIMLNSIEDKERLIRKVE